MQLLPDFRVWPFANVLVRGALNVEPHQLRRAHAEQRKTARMKAVDQLLGDRSRLRQNAEPAERIFPLVRSQDAVRNARSADAVKAVAAADEIAIELVHATGMLEANLRRASQFLDADIADIEKNLPAIGQPAGDQVFHHLVLAIDQDAFADERFEIDVTELIIEAEMNPAMHKPLALHAFADGGLHQEIGGPVLDHAGANARLDVFPAAIFKNDGLDALEMQEVRQHQPRGSRPDDPYLGAHSDYLRKTATQPTHNCEEPMRRRNTAIAANHLLSIQAQLGSIRA